MEMKKHRNDVAQGSVPYGTNGAQSQLRLFLRLQVHTVGAPNKPLPVEISGMSPMTFEMFYCPCIVVDERRSVRVQAVSEAEKARGEGEASFEDLTLRRRQLYNCGENKIMMMWMGFRD